MTSVEELALRCLFPGFEGSEAPDWVRRRVASGLGGVVLFARNVDAPEHLTALSDALHGERPQLVIAIDEEGGDVTRLEARSGSSYPGNLALGVADDVGLTRDVAAAIGAELARRGIDLDLAPVADVNSNPLNPVIGVRSFGSDASPVARHTAAWIEGLQSTGVAACAKHFPGHGDTSIDSHLALPVVDEDPHLRALRPFRSAISSGVMAIMSAHIVATAIDRAPATISRRIMTALLRDELGFKGIAITDGLEMRGLSDGVGMTEGAVLSLIAGCDALCIGGGLAGEDAVEDIVRAVAAAIRQGRLAEERLNEAASRVDALAAWCSHRGESGRESRDIGLVAARRAVVAEGPTRIGGEAVVARFTTPTSMVAGGVPWGMAAALSTQGVRVSAFDVDAEGGAHSLEAPLRVAAGKSLVAVVRDLHRRLAQREAIDSLLGSRPDAVVVEMGLPLCRPGGAMAYIATNGSARVCAEAAAEVMTGMTAP